MEARAAVQDEGIVEGQRILGGFKFLCGSQEEARKVRACGLRRAEELGTLPARARILETRGRWCLQSRDIDEARRLLEQCEPVQQET